MRVRNTIKQSEPSIMLNLKSKRGLVQISTSDANI